MTVNFNNHITFNEAEDPTSKNEALADIAETYSPVVEKVLDAIISKISLLDNKVSITRTSKEANGNRNEPSQPEVNQDLDETGKEMENRLNKAVEIVLEGNGLEGLYAMEYLGDALKQGYTLVQGPGASYTLLAPDGTEVTAKQTKSESPEPVTGL